MSKAFTRESDDLPDRPALRPPSSLPPGAKNYLTPGGALRLREELDRLVQIERPRVAALPTDDEMKRQLQGLDQRIHHLQQSLHSAVVVSPPESPEDRARFGATVTVRETNGEDSRYRIVGVDETDIDRGWVSWVSPIAKALLNARLGQRIRFKFPAGEKELEVVGIAYE
jgi:transcription elongation factor GreB